MLLKAIKINILLIPHIIVNKKKINECCNIIMSYEFIATYMMLKIIHLALFYFNSGFRLISENVAISGDTD